MRERGNPETHTVTLNIYKQGKNHAFINIAH
jgi:hypothetical protein